MSSHLRTGGNLIHVSESPSPGERKRRLPAVRSFHTWTPDLSFHDTFWVASLQRTNYGSRVTYCDGRGKMKKAKKSRTAAKARKPKATKARAEGLRLYRLAGKPTREQVVLVYGERGPVMTWEERAEAGVPAKISDSGAPVSSASRFANRDNNLAFASAKRPMGHRRGYASSGCSPSARSRRIHSRT